MHVPVRTKLYARTRRLHQVTVAKHSGDASPNRAAAAVAGDCGAIEVDRKIRLEVAGLRGHHAMQS